MRWPDIMRARKSGGMRGFFVFVIAAVLFNCTAFTHGCKRSGRRVNVILIIVDALRADHLGAYGYEKPASPFFDAWSRKGILFENCMSQSSWTKTSMASLLTGMEAETTRVFAFKDTLPEEAVTMAEVLSANGYQTAYVQTNAWLYNEFAFGQGFENRAQLGPETDKWPEKKAAYRAWAVNEQAERWLEDRDRDRPFFLYLHYMDVHSPYIPPPPHNTIFDPDFPRELRDYIFTMKYIYNNLTFSSTAERIFEKLKSDHDMLGHLVSLYDGEINYFDAEFRKLMRTLEEKDLFDNTLIIFGSDHGEQFMEHGKLRHANSLYIEELHVPLVFCLPGVLPEEKRIETPVRNLDIFPTVMDILGIKHNLPVEGGSLYDLMRGRSRGYEPGQSFSRLKIESEWPINRQDQASLRDGEWVIIRDHLRGVEELYNLDEDPQEHKDLSLDMPKVLKEMSFKLDESVRLSGEARTLAGLPEAPRKTELDEHMKESLEAIGYINR